MGKLRKAAATGALIASLWLGSACGLSDYVEKSVSIQRTQQAAEIQKRVETLVSTLMPENTPAPNYAMHTPTPSAAWPSLTPTPTLDPFTALMVAEKQRFMDGGFSGAQFETYLNMGMEEKIAFYELSGLAGNGADFYSLRLTPDSLVALWDYLNGFDEGVRNEILLQPDSPINMMGSRLYVLDVSDNSTPYFLALAADVMGERFGLEEKLLVDNSEPESGISKAFDTYYQGDPHKIGMTVQDRVDEILAFRESDKAGEIIGLSGDELSQYIRENGPGMMRNAGMRQIETAILEIEREEREKGDMGPLTIYIIAHSHLSAPRLLVNSVYESYGPDELFTKKFFSELAGSHINFVVSTCPFSWLDEFQKFLDKQPITYTITTSYVDSSTGTSLGDLANAIEVAANVRPDETHPVIDLSKLEQVAEGTLESGELFVRENEDSTSHIYSFWPYEIIEGVRERWTYPDENGVMVGRGINLEITHGGEQTIPLLSGGYFTYDVRFRPAVLSNLPYQDRIALFGLNLEQMADDSGQMK